MTNVARASCEICGKRRVDDLLNAMVSQELISELCCCEVSAEFVEAIESEDIVVCKKCSKRMQERIDSTHWFFRHAFCSCQSPSPWQLDSEMVGDLVNQLLFQKKKQKERPSKPEAEIQVDERKFPIEAFKPLKMIEGSGGRVFRCRDRQLGTLAAIKILRNPPQPEQLNQLHQEAKIVSELDHDNILKVLDFGIIRELYPFMVTEFAGGETVRSMIDKSGRIQVYDTMDIISQVCEGLSYAHSRGVFHWNLTPDSIVLANSSKADRVVKIADFGFALNAVAGRTFQSKQGTTLVGTTGYMSPEHATGEAYDASSEIYSIGCMMFEMLTGELPFAGETPKDVYIQQTENPVPKLKDISQREFPHQLERIVGRCLQKNKDLRYTSVDQLRKAIIAFASQPSVRPETKPEPKWKTALEEHKVLIGIVLGGVLVGLVCVSYVWLLSESAFNTLGKSGLATENFLVSLGNDYAKTELGRKYLQGTGVPQDKDKAIQLLSDGAARGSASAEFWLGYCYLQGFARLQKHKEVQANAISSITQTTASDLKNYAHAYKLISQAAEKGYPTAERYMGLLIRLGMDETGQITPLTSKGRTKRLADSAAWLKKAADQGDPEAINYLGIETAEGFGWSPDSYPGDFDYSEKFDLEKEKMFKLFQKAAEAGQPDAQFNIALCYELGVGTKVNNEQAKKWYQLAANSDLQDANFRYGFLLEQEKSPDAVKWYKKAALKNNLYAEIALCRCYSEGFCIPADLVQAQYWFDKVRERPDRFYAGKETLTTSANSQQSHEKQIAAMDNICRDHLEMPHLLVQKWGPSGIKCWPKGPMRDIDLMQLSTMKDVTFLDLYGMSIHDRGTKFLPGLPITMLRLAGQDLSSSGYGNVAKLRQLKGVELSGDQQSDGLGKLADCRELVFVGATGKINQGTVDQLAAIKSLKNIAFHCRDDINLAPWGGLPNLESLRLDEVTQKTVNSLAAMKNLKALTIESFKQKGSAEKMDLTPLMKLSRLEKLRLNQSLNEHTVAQLKTFKQLKNLSLTSTKGVSDSDLYLLKQIPAKSIEIFLDADCEITDRGLMILGSIPNVSHVNISVSPVTPGGVKAFRAKFPNHSVTYSENGKKIKDKETDAVKDQVEKQIKKQINDQIEKQKREQAEKAKAAAKKQIE